MHASTELTSAPVVSTFPIQTPKPPPSGPIAHVTVLDVPFHSLRRDEAVDVIERYIQERQPRHVCLSNAYTMAVATYDSHYLEVLNRADLVLADGMSIVWGSRWIGLRLPQRVAGPDLMSSLCELAAHTGYRIYLLGSSEENLSRLKDVLLLKWPKLHIAGQFSPPMCDRIDDAENANILAKLNTAKPDILFVGMSAPKQEKWIAENLSKLNVPVSIGVGAAFDFLSGRIPRAPEPLQRSGLEWLYRLYCEPRRLWKRYLLGNLIFLSRLGSAWLRLRLSPVR